MSITWGLTDEERAASDRNLRALEARIRYGWNSYLDWINLEADLDLNWERELLMKMTYTTPSGRLQFEFDVSTGKLAFETVAKVQELFEEAECGKCQSKAIRCSVREHDDNKFYNMICNACGAQLDFGQRKDGSGMWIKCHDKEGHALAYRGWYIYNRQAKAGDAFESSSSDNQAKEPTRSFEDVPF